MTTGLDMAEIGFLVGDPARANMLNALLDGRARTAGELAFFARVSPQTASLHLRRLTEANLVTVVAQGRHRYFRLASPLVGQMLESISAVAAIHAPPRHRPRSASDSALRELRMCYDHLAGRLSVEIADALIARGSIILDDEAGLVTDSGARLFAELGIDLAAGSKRRAFCRPCLDWTERRYHIAGAVGSALATHALAEGWIARSRYTRAVTLTAKGRGRFAELLGTTIRAEPKAA